MNHDCLMNYGWRLVILYRRQGSRPSQEKEMKKKQNGCLRRPYKLLCKEKNQKVKEKKERYTHLDEEFRRIARRDKKAFLSNQCKDIEENNRMGD